MVKTLPRYLLRQVLATLVLTVVVFTFVLLLVNVLRDVLRLLISQQATGRLVFEALGLLLPFVLMFALPMGMLTAALLVFGRFSADQELTAARASGISLLTLIGPVLGFSLLLCGVSALINLELAPRCRVAYKDLLFRLKVRMASMYLPEGRFVRDVPGCILYVRKNDGRHLRDVLVYLLHNQSNVVMRLRAPRGEYTVDADNRRLELRLFEARSVVLNEGEWRAQYFGEWIYELDLQPGRIGDEKTDIRDMTFAQLWRELKELESLILTPAESPPGTAADGRAHLDRLRGLRAELISPLRVVMHRQVAFSFACFGFTLVGIPLGVRLHRRETNVGIAVALVLVALYYSFLLLGESLAARPESVPHLIVWLPNFLFQTVGAVLLWRVNRGW